MLSEKELSLSPKEKLETDSKELEVYQEQYILSKEAALDILEEKYGPNFIACANGEFKIDDWQSAKKIEHADLYGINFADYDFSQKQAVEINRGNGGLDSSFSKRGKKFL